MKRLRSAEKTSLFCALENKRMNDSLTRIRDFVRREGITWHTVFNFKALFGILFRYRYVHFFVTGSAGVLINLLITSILTEFFLGRENYFTAYIFGIMANLFFNFSVYTLHTFRTTTRHLKRFAIFIFYSLAMTYIQALIVKTITPVIGVDFYLFVIGGVILFFSVFNFLVFKMALFYESNEGAGLRENGGGVQSPSFIFGVPRTLFFAIVASFLIHLGGLIFLFISNGGLERHIYGDAVGYIELATNLREGNGFVSTLGGGVVPDTFRTPGLPLLLSPFTGSVFGLFVYFLILSAIASFAIPAFTWHIGRSLFNERVGFLAAVLTAFEPMLIFFSWLPLTEIPFMIIFLATISAFLKSVEKESVIWILISGALLGYSLLIRPSFVPVVGISLLAIFLYFLLRDKKFSAQIILIGVVAGAVLFPWYVRTHDLTGRWALSGTGWRNVYTDFVSSVHALKNGTSPALEKRAMKDEFLASGHSLADLNSPAFSDQFRKLSLEELKSNWLSVIRLEAALIPSFFTNDGWYYTASQLGLIPRLPAHISPTRVFLDEGISGIGKIFEQLKGQFFIPVIGRIVTTTIVVLATIGIVANIRKPAVLLFAFLIGLLAVISTATGFGVEARFRLPIMPFLFALSALGLFFLLDWLKRIRVKN